MLSRYEQARSNFDGNAIDNLPKNCSLAFKYFIILTQLNAFYIEWEIFQMTCQSRIN